MNNRDNQVKRNNNIVDNMQCNLEEAEDRINENKNNRNNNQNNKNRNSRNQNNRNNNQNR